MSFFFAISVFPLFSSCTPCCLFFCVYFYLHSCFFSSSSDIYQKALFSFPRFLFLSLSFFSFWQRLQRDPKTPYSSNVQPVSLILPNPSSMRCVVAEHETMLDHLIKK